MTDVRRVVAYKLDDHAFEVLEDSLEPFIMSDAVSSIATLARSAEDGLYYVCNSDELEHVYAEVSVIANGNVHAPQYYGGEVYLSIDSSRSSLSSSRSVLASDARHSSLSSSHGVSSTHGGGNGHVEPTVLNGIAASSHTVSTLRDAGGRVVPISSRSLDKTGNLEQDEATNATEKRIPFKTHGPALMDPHGHAVQPVSQPEATTASSAILPSPVTSSSSSAEMQMPTVLSPDTVVPSLVARMPTLLGGDVSVHDRGAASEKGGDVTQAVEEQLAQLRQLEPSMRHAAVPFRLHGGVEIIDDVGQRSTKVLSLRAKALHGRHSASNITMNITTGANETSGATSKSAAALGHSSSVSTPHPSQLAAPHRDTPPSPEEGSMVMGGAATTNAPLSHAADAAHVRRPLITMRDAWFVLQTRQYRRSAQAERRWWPSYHPLKAHPPPPPPTSEPVHDASHGDDVPREEDKAATTTAAATASTASSSAPALGNNPSTSMGDTSHVSGGSHTGHFGRRGSGSEKKGAAADSVEATPSSPSAATTRDSEAGLSEWSALAVMNHLLNESGALYVKTPLATCRSFLDDLHIDQLFFPANMGYSSPIMEPLLLRPSTYFMWAMLSERGAGTRTHVGPMGSHALHILLRGKKRWIVAHPLDKHLLTHPKTGQPADLASINHTLYPHARHARLFTFVQDAGEALFIPCDALHCEMCEEDSVALLVQFMDDSNAYMYEKHSVLNALIEQPTKKLNLLSSKLVPYTTIDLILFDHNVYPSFRGNNRPYQPDAAQTVIVLRAILQLEQVRLPCDELGARVNLDALQFCFGLLGQALLHRTGASGSVEPFYVVGVPKGFLVSRFDNHVALYYFVEPPSFAAIKDCLHTKADEVCVDMQYFERTNVTLPVITYFRSTSSQRGHFLDYVPLSVLFNQRWPFEQELVRNLISVPSIILSKTYHPQGFIRPGSVWHYSRFQLHPFDTVARGAELHPVLETDCEEMWLDAHKTSMALEQHEATNDAAGGSSSSNNNRNTDHGSNHDNSGHDESAKNGTSRPELSSAMATQAHLGVTVDSAYTVARQWCRTFLFYCCPVLNKPISLCPLQSGPGLQSAESVSCVGKELPFHPQIVELQWNIQNLQEYGVAQLIQLEDDCDAEITSKVVEHPSFEAFQRFTDEHGLIKPDQAGSTQMEVIMPAVMWFLCTPGLVGYVCREEQYAAHEHRPDRRTETATKVGDSDTHTDAAAAAHPSGAVAEADKDASAADGKDDFTMKELPTQQETVCLTACAASVFLSCVINSTYALLVTRLCNWLCDVAEEGTTDREASLFALLKETLQSSHEEAKAIIFQVIDIKKGGLAACIDCGKSAAIEPHDAATLTGRERKEGEEAASTTRSGDDGKQCCHGGKASSHSGATATATPASIVNRDKLTRLEKFCLDVQHEKSSHADAQPKV